MRARRWTFTILAVTAVASVAFVSCSAPANDAETVSAAGTATQERGGQEEFGPYELVRNWPHLEKMFSQDRCGRGPHKIKMSPYDPEKHVWVVDDFRHAIFKFTNDGKRLVQTIGTYGEPGADAAHFFRPTFMAWLPDGGFFVADGYENTRVVKFAASGEYLMAWGSKGTPPNDTRPGYGYCGIPDPYKDVLAPDKAGIWRMDLRTGKHDLIVSYAQAAAVPYKIGDWTGSKHKFNHLLVAPDGSRFIFLHRRRGGRFAARDRVAAGLPLGIDAVMRAEKTVLKRHRSQPQQAVLVGSGPRAFVQRDEELARLLLVRREQHRHVLPEGEREESSPKGTRVLLLGDLGEVAFDEDHRYRIRFLEAQHLIEDTLRHDGSEEIGERLPLDRDLSDDIVARRDLSDLDIRAEFSQPGGDVRRLTLVDDDHGRANRRSSS